MELLHGQVRSIYLRALVTQHMHNYIVFYLCRDIWHCAS